MRRLEAAGPTPDGDLLGRFSAHADPDAFELLVHRHAPVVLRICRAVARDPHLAEDAAQAVFLALARRAGALVGARSVAGWVARVAYRAVRRARARSAARPVVTLAPESHAAPGPDPADAEPAFDEALAKEKKFVVVGRVTEADGKTPIEGAGLTASAGMGSLRRTGQATTDQDGRFRLVFRAGLLMEGGRPGGVAVVHVRKPGWYGWSYGWPAQFVLTDEPLTEPEQKQYPGYTNLTPGRPSRLIFRMQPAASLKVKLVDGAGKPLAGTRVWVTGDKLAPATSVLADGRTDAAGEFAVANVPRSLYRVVIVDPPGGRPELELGAIRFRDAAEYEAVGTVHQWEPGETHVEWKVRRGKER